LNQINSGVNILEHNEEMRIIAVGDELSVGWDCCRNLKGQVVARFSKQFMKQIETLKQYNYVPKAARVRFILYWKKENTEHEIRIILPEIHFEKEEKQIAIEKS